MMISDPVVLNPSSMIEKLNPQTRLLCTFFLSICISLSRNFSILAVYTGIVVALLATAGAPFSQVFRRVKPALIFLVMIWVILPVTYDQGPFFRYGWLKVSQPGVMLCSLISIKSVIILVLFTIFVASMPAAAIGSGLYRLNVPEKLVFLFLMAFRYIHVIYEEYQRLMRAAKFRGFRPATTLHAYKTYAYLAGMLFVRASFRANRVYQAMLCRGFTGKFHTLEIYSTHLNNRIFVAATLTAGLVLSGLEFFWK